MQWMEQEELLKRLDKIIGLLETIAKQPTLAKRISTGFANGVTILGVISIVNIIKGWLGG